MKQFFSLMILYAFLSPVQAQNTPIADNLKADVVDNNLLITWTEATASEKGSWEVQASADGKNFSTIGLVWGASPAGNGYAFKQQTNKIKSNYKYYRVLYLAETNAVAASNTIGLSK